MKLYPPITERLRDLLKDYDFTQENFTPPPYTEEIEDAFQQWLGRPACEPDWIEAFRQLGLLTDEEACLGLMQIVADELADMAIARLARISKPAVCA